MSEICGPFSSRSHGSATETRKPSASDARARLSGSKAEPGSMIEVTPLFSMSRPSRRELAYSSSSSTALIRRVY